MFFLQITAQVLHSVMSLSYLEAHERGISRAVIFSAFLLSGYLLLAILRGFIVGFASPKLSFYFSTPLILLAGAILLFLIFVPFAAKYDKNAGSDYSTFSEVLMVLLSIAFVLIAISLWSALTRVPKMEARYCRAALERLSPELEGKANLALDLARRVLKDDTPWLTSCQEIAHIE